MGNKHPTEVLPVAMMLVEGSTDLFVLRVAVAHKGSAAEAPFVVFLVLPLEHMDLSDRCLAVQLVVVRKGSSAVPLAVMAPAPVLQLVLGHKDSFAVILAVTVPARPGLQPVLWHKDLPDVPLVVVAHMYLAVQPSVDHKDPDVPLSRLLGVHKRRRDVPPREPLRALHFRF